MDHSFLLTLPNYFLGYGIYVLLFLVLRNRPFFASKRRILLEFDDTTSRLTAFFGLLYLLVLCGLIFIRNFVFIPGDHASTDFDRKPLDILFLAAPVFMCIFTQFLWKRKNSQRVWIKVIIAVFALELYQSFILFLTASERDYMPESGSEIANNIFFKVLLGSAIFLVSSLLVFGLSRLSKKASKN